MPRPPSLSRSLPRDWPGAGIATPASLIVLAAGVIGTAALMTLWMDPGPALAATIKAAWLLIVPGWALLKLAPLPGSPSALERWIVAGGVGIAYLPVTLFLVSLTGDVITEAVAHLLAVAPLLLALAARHRVTPPAADRDD